MRQVVLAVRDRQLNAYMRPFHVPTTGAGIRAFQDEVNRAESEMRRHPADYELYQLAEWDEETGMFYPLEMPKQLAIASQLLTK